MAFGNGILTEVRLEVDGLSGHISLPDGMQPSPGQYLAATGPDPFEPLAVNLFPSGIVPGDDLRVVGPMPATWTAGTALRLRGPLGNGFHLPHSARRVALASFEGSPGRLMPLVGVALSQQAAVTIYTRGGLAHVPSEVEILPLDLLPEALTWADYLALEARLEHIPDLRASLGLPPYQRPACQVQVLVLAAMPCNGLAECGVCAVATRDGWALTCSDGPVFDFNQLEGI